MTRKHTKQEQSKIPNLKSKIDMVEIKVGTIEPLTEEKPEQKPRSPRRTGGSGGNGRPRKGGGGGGGDNGGSGGGGDQPESEQRAAAKSIQKYRISMWAIVGVAFMTFTGLTLAYMMLAANPQLEWKPFDLPFQLWISTAIIIASSLTYEFSKNNLHSARQLAARNWLAITTGLGAVFIASQVLAWLELVSRGVYVSGNPYAGFFYILTIAHALHVIGGMAALGYVVLKTWQPTDSRDELKKRVSAAEISGLFWHFLTGLWIALFLLLGFWK
jgi:cytochrome c oxidase subunit 3